MHGRPPSRTKLVDIRATVEQESEHLVQLAARVRKRLKHHLVRTADARALPDADWRESAKWYSRVVVELRRFAAGQHAAPKSELSQAEYEEEIAIIAREHLRSLSAPERARLLADEPELS